MAETVIRKEQLKENEGSQRTDVAVKVRLGTTMTNLPNASYTTVELDTENYDVGSDFNTTTYTFTAPVTGYYLVNGFVRLLNAVTGSYQLLFNVTGTGNNYGLRQNVNASVYSRPNLYQTAVMYLTASDTSVMRIYNDSGASTPDLDSAELTINLIST